MSMKTYTMYEIYNKLSQLSDLNKDISKVQHSIDRMSKINAQNNHMLKQSIVNNNTLLNGADGGNLVSAWKAKTSTLQDDFVKGLVSRWEKKSGALKDNFATGLVSSWEKKSSGIEKTFVSNLGSKVLSEGEKFNKSLEGITGKITDLTSLVNNIPKIVSSSGEKAVKEVTNGVVSEVTKTVSNFLTGPLGKILDIGEYLTESGYKELKPLMKEAFKSASELTKHAKASGSSAYGFAVNDVAFSKLGLTKDQTLSAIKAFKTSEAGKALIGNSNSKDVGLVFKNWITDSNQSVENINKVLGFKTLNNKEELASLLKGYVAAKSTLLKKHSGSKNAAEFNENIQATNKEGMDLQYRKKINMYINDNKLGRQLSSGPGKPSHRLIDKADYERITKLRDKKKQGGSLSKGELHILSKYKGEELEEEGGKYYAKSEKVSHLVKQIDAFHENKYIREKQTIGNMGTILTVESMKEHIKFMSSEVRDFIQKELIKSGDKLEEEIIKWKDDFMKEMRKFWDEGKHLFEDGLSWIEHLFGLGSAPDHSEQQKKKAMISPQTNKPPPQTNKPPKK